MCCVMHALPQISNSSVCLVFFFLTAATALVEGKINKNLKKVLKKVVAKEAHEQLAISDAKLGGVIKVSDKIFNGHFLNLTV